MQTLESWNEKFGSNEELADAKTSDARGGKSRFEMDLDVAYPVSVKRARIVTSQRGKRQLELTLNVLKGEEVAGETRAWLELPKQPEADLALEQSKGIDVVRKIILRRRDDLNRIYAAADPKQFAVYAERTKGEDGKYHYIGHDGKELSNDAYRAREREVKLAMLAYADDLFERDGEDLDDLVDTFFYMAKVANKEKPQYPYVNYYTYRPDKLPVFGE